MPLVKKTPHSISSTQSFCQLIQGTTIQEDETMVSFDVVSLFTSIPTTLAVETARDRLNSDPSLSNRTSLNPEDICKLLEFCLNSTVFSFEGIFYKQQHGTAMGSPVSGVVADLCMESVEIEALQNPIFNIRLWKRYVDDTYVILPTSEIADFHRYLNSINPYIQFTLETQKNNSLPFLDVMVSRDQTGNLSTTVYRKSTHTDRYLDFQSHHPTCHKASVVRTLLKRPTTHCSNNLLEQEEIQHTNKALALNGFPKKFISHQTSTLAHPHVNKDPKKFHVVLPYVRGISEQISRLLDKADVKTFYKPISTLRSILSQVKDKTPASHHNQAVYKIPCKDCNKVYIGQTKRTIASRMKEHQRDLRTEAQHSQLAQHAFAADHMPDFNAACALHRNVKAHSSRLLLESWESYTIGQTTNACQPLPEPYKRLITLSKTKLLHTSSTRRPPSASKKIV